MSAKQLRALNAERQKQLVADTEKLLRLAKELNRELGRNDSTSTADLERKVSQIEKLARSVKDKMSESVAPGPSVGIPQFPFPH